MPETGSRTEHGSIWITRKQDILRSIQYIFQRISKVNLQDLFEVWSNSQSIKNPYLHLHVHVAKDCPIDVPRFYLWQEMAALWYPRVSTNIKSHAGSHGCSEPLIRPELEI